MEHLVFSLLSLCRSKQGKQGIQGHALCSACQERTHVVEKVHSEPNHWLFPFDLPPPIFISRCCFDFSRNGNSWMGKSDNWVSLTNHIWKAAVQSFRTHKPQAIATGKNQRPLLAAQRTKQHGMRESPGTCSVLQSDREARRSQQLREEQRQEAPASSTSFCQIQGHN